MKVTLIAHTPNPLYVCAEAASVCYDSEPSLKVVKGCIRSGHCYDRQTEVLTSQGFIKWENVNYDTKIANVNPNTKEIVGFYSPLALIAYPYEGEMIKFENKYVDLMVTPEHNIYCSLSNTAYKRSHPTFSLMAANKFVQCSNGQNDFIYRKPLRMTTSAINAKGGEGNPLYKLYGFFIGDGYCSTDNSKIEFHLKKERKIQFLKEICKECGLELTEQAADKYRIDANGFRTLFYNNNKEKTFPDYFFMMNKENFDFFFEGLINSDGYAGKTSLQYNTSSKELKDKLSALFAINDIVFTVSEKQNIYTLTINLKNKNPMFNDSRSKYYGQKINYSGMVYCAETETGLIIVRRNGKIVLCGNCSVLEHATFTFRIEGISRACSHQLVRHRMASYSQQSQRYVKYDNLDWVEDGLNRENIESISATCDYALLAYKNLTNKGVPAEQARAVLPNATPTTIYVTMNVRALMNFFNERLCTRAQSEIRHLATSMKIEILAAKDISEEEKEIFNKLFVPKCEKYPTHFCSEIKGCGRHPQLKNFIEQKNGNWVTLPGTIENTFVIRCSECGVAQDINTFNFCPNCGAKMTR